MKSPLLRFLLTSALVILLVRAASGEEAVAARVDGTPILASELEAALARTVPANGSTYGPDEKIEVLQQLVEEKLIFREAQRKGVDRDPAVQKVMINTLLKQDVYGTVKNSDFTDEQLQAFWNAHPDAFIVPEKVQIKRILIKVDEARTDAVARETALALRDQVATNPGSFKDVAAQHSEDPYKRRGGDVGFVSREGKPGLEAAVVERAFRLSVGEISEVFRTDEGYNIILVASAREKVERTFQQMKGSVLRKVKNDKMREVYVAYVQRLTAGAKVERVEEVIAGVNPVPVRAQPATEPDDMLDPDEGL